MAEKPPQFQQADFLDELNRAENPAEEKKKKIEEVQKEADAQAAQETGRKYRKKNRVHEIENSLPGVRLGPRDRKYHWE